MLEGKTRKNAPNIGINDLLKGKGRLIIEQLKETLIEIIESGVNEVKAPREFDKFVNQKRTMKTPRENIEDLIKHGTMLDKIDYCIRKSQNYENLERQVTENTNELAEVKQTMFNLLVHYGVTLHNQRGLKF